jgi:hypothetical protein
MKVRDAIWNMIDRIEGSLNSNAFPHYADQESGKFFTLKTETGQADFG